ncbi:hypothetical protein QU487_06750 [Crenobacter sp. SG2305]|uniref:hypothetical protein n=1 Tax=Crenobacter oryzisoli TaxID=3056844 RepID=UPI0025AAE23E|nr:hypothetical protein [Crenobacter sp. SG2305]MDN0082453.1 hypothetical protein [Crenobacter sp. SG2305]
MNLLQTRPVARGNEIRVYVNHCKLEASVIAIDIALDPSIRQNLIAAELLAMRYALSELGLGGFDRKHGRGLLLEVTHGAIRKLSRLDSAFQALAPFAQFIQTRYLGAEIEVNKDDFAWARDEDVAKVHRIGCDPVPEQIHTRFGSMVPTAHILQCMVDRAMTAGLDRALNVLTTQLTSIDTRRLAWSDAAAARCRVRYGKDSELLYHRSSQNMFVVTREPDGVRRLVTAYKVDNLTNQHVEACA